ncbi:hypothetical protein PI125_g21354 [Phytophthora idaei]|nr:hypothetical protein PI125_g21354 [Phytophthora idaei]
MHQVDDGLHFTGLQVFRARRANDLVQRSADGRLDRLVDHADGREDAGFLLSTVWATSFHEAGSMPQS